MTTKQFLEMQRELLSVLPGFAVGKRLLYARCPKYVLRGLCFDGSNFDKKAFYVNVFAMPLYVPHEYLAFTICERLRSEKGGDRWNIGMPKIVESLQAAIKDQAVPFLGRVSNLQSFCDQLGKRSHDNPNITVANAFGLVLLGKEFLARQLMEELVLRLDFNVGWQRTIADRVGLIKAKLNDGGDRARQQLELWAIETLERIDVRPGNQIMPHDGHGNTQVQEQL